VPQLAFCDGFRTYGSVTLMASSSSNAVVNRVKLMWPARLMRDGDVRFGSTRPAAGLNVRYRLAAVIAPTPWR
jgi:hypothetical protein